MNRLTAQPCIFALKIFVKKICNSTTYYFYINRNRPLSRQPRIVKLWMNDFKHSGYNEQMEQMEVKERFGRVTGAIFLHHQSARRHTQIIKLSC